MFEFHRVISIIVFGFSSIGQLLMLAYFGSSIESSSNEISSANYENDWLETDTQYKKHLIIAMISASKPVVIKVGKIFEVNLSTFVFVS